MMSKWLWTVAFLLLALPSGRAGLIPNGDFETGDFTGWGPQPGGTPGNVGVASVEFVDGSYRAVIQTIVADGPGVSGGEMLTSSSPLTWGNGKILQFDASYSYATDSLGALVSFEVTTSSQYSLILLHAMQEDFTPLSGSSPMTTYFMPWDGKAIDVFPTVFTQNSGSVSLTVILDNFQIIPEPSTWVLVATALCALPLVVRRQRRR